MPASPRIPLFPLPKGLRVFPAAFLLMVLAGLACRQANAADPHAAETSAFGSETESGSALMGIFYDLKQTQQQVPTGVDVNSYGAILDSFVVRGFDEMVMNQYYRSTKPMYTTQIYIPMMAASAAPRAFGMGEYVKGTRWVIHYKGQVVPPTDGTYRFCGFADDVIVVMVDGKVDLEAGLFNHTFLFKAAKWQSTEPPGIKMVDGRMTMGDWFAATPSKPIDLDILIGERPGGIFGAILTIQKQGETYPIAPPTDKDPGGVILPLFQVAPYSGTLKAPGGCQLAPAPPPWKCLQ